MAVSPINKALNPLPDYFSDWPVVNTKAMSLLRDMGLPKKNEFYKYSDVGQWLKTGSFQPQVAQPVITGDTKFIMIHDRPFITDSDRFFDQVAVAVEGQVYQITIPDHVSTEIRLDWLCPAGAIVSPVIHIKLGAHATCHIIETIAVDDAGWFNAPIFVDLAEQADLQFTSAQKSSGIITREVTCTEAKGASFHLSCLYLGKGKWRQSGQVFLNGHQAQFHLNAAGIGCGHYDTTFHAVHQGMATTSKQNIRHILGHAACGVYQGKVFIAKGANESDGYQLSKAILLEPTAHMNAKPELEIYTDAVKSAHGATTGTLDANQIFYLMSRGLSRSAAQAILIDGFIAEIYSPATYDFFVPYIHSSMGEIING
jgi:Fe-S cluster assembly protein SufD